ncbi:MAG: hypothetical protein ACLUD0_01415 [Eubacterium ramulus]
MSEAEQPRGEETVSIWNGWKTVDSITQSISMMEKPTKSGWRIRNPSEKN